MSRAAAWTILGVRRECGVPVLCLVAIDTGVAGLNNNNNDIRPDPELQDIGELIARYRTDQHRFEGDAVAYRVLHHIERYWFAADTLGSAHGTLKVIDMGCGNGIGLAQFAARSAAKLDLSGVELDEAASEEASRALPVRIFNTGIEELSVPEQFDAVICFETIGFSTLSSDANLLDVLDTYCAPGGTIFVSAPNYRGRQQKQYFERTYSLEDLHRLLGSFFADRAEVACFGQLYPTNRRAPGDVGVRDVSSLSAPPDFSIAVVKKHDPDFQTHL